MTTLATRANMRKFREANPGRAVVLPDGTIAHIEGRTCVAFSLTTGEEWSATEGDYYMHSEHEPLLDENGEPCVLAIKVCRYEDALTGETL